MGYAIRLWRDADADALPEVWRRAITEIGSLKYTPEQVEAWLGWRASPDKYRDRVAAGATILVACDVADRPVAYALLEPDGHLDHLYNHPCHTRRGLARQLLTEAETLARKWGCARLYTEASELARPAFERAGYTVSHRRDFAIRGVAIHNFAMEKTLA